jgi:hypothetical protein
MKERKVIFSFESIADFFYFSSYPPPTEMSAPTSSTNAITTPAATTQQAQTEVPGPGILVQAAKLAIAQDKPILLDYYVETATGKAFIGEDKETKEQILVKSQDEFTSLIQKLYKGADGNYLVITENSIYIVSSKIQKRVIDARSLRDKDE